MTDGNSEGRFPALLRLLPLQRPRYLKLLYSGRWLDVPVLDSIKFTGFQPHLRSTIKTDRFSVTGDAGTAGVCNVTFPTQLLGGPFTVLMDGSPHPATVTSNATYSSIFFTYSHSTHQFEIMGTTVVPEFPTIVSITMVLTVLTLVLFLTKRRLASLDPQSSWHRQVIILVAIIFRSDLWSSTRANH